MRNYKITWVLGMFVAFTFILQSFTGVSYARPAMIESEGTGETTSDVYPLASRSGITQTESSFVHYSVKAGDTLYLLARQFNTDIDTLIAMNNVTDPKALQIGQPLVIPKQLKQEEVPAAMGIDKIMSFHLTAYTAGAESTGKNPGDPGYGITSTGKRATEGRTIAVDPRVIPYGTKVYIEGVGIRTAEDTGGAIKGNRIDVFIEDLNQAVHFGVKKNVRVYVLSSPNA